MIRGTAKWSFRLGLLVVVALVIKKVLDSQRPKPALVVPVTPPRPRPRPMPEPEPVRVVEPEPKLVVVEAEPEPAAEPTPDAESGPEPVAKAPAGKRPRRAEPLKAKRAAKLTERPVRANRKVPVDATADGPRSAMVSWVEPVGTVCPTSHPIKAKLGSKVFRKPGMTSYETSKPDRCYASEGAARRAGFTEAQR